MLEEVLSFVAGACFGALVTMWVMVRMLEKLVDSLERELDRVLRELEKG